MPQILMLQPDDSPAMVDEADFDSALQAKLEPAFEMQDQNGKKVRVRKSHYDQAKQAGLKDWVVEDARRNADKKMREEIRSEPVGYGESFGRGVANTTTMGFADELAGLGAVPGAVLGGKPIKETYKNTRDAYRERDDTAYEQNPKTYGAGYVAGSLPTLAGSVGKLGGAKGAAAFGALAGAGSGTDAEGQADLTEGEVRPWLKGVGVGAGTSAALGFAGDKAVGAVARNLKPAAESLAYRSTGALKSDINKLYGAGADKSKEARAIGRTLLDEGAVPVFGKRGGEAIEKGIENSLGKYRQKQDAFLSQLDAMEKGGVPLQDIAKKIEAQIAESRAMPGRSNQAYADALQGELDLILQKGKRTQTQPPRNVTPNSQPADRNQMLKEMIFERLQGQNETPRDLSFEEATDVKRAFDRGGKYQSNTEAASVEGARSARKAVKDSIDENISKVAGPEQMEAYKADRMSSKRLIDAKRAMEQNTQRETANKIFGLTDTIAAGPAATIGFAQGGLQSGAIYAGAALGLKKLAEGYGDAFGARMFDAAAKGIERYGLDETIKKLSSTIGPKAAEQIRQKIMEGSPK